MNISNPLRIATFALLGAVLIASVTQHIIQEEPVLQWYDIVLVALILFAGIGQSVSKVVVKPTELTIEQTVKDYRDEVERVNRFATDASGREDLRSFVDHADGQPRDTWSRLVLIRTLLRGALRAIAVRHAIEFGDSPSIRQMLERFKRDGIIDDKLATEVESIRDATYSAEWGGDPPDPAKLKFALSDYDRILTALKQHA